MNLAIMQPYFLPYIGYFQLINAVDTFVIYDNIKYTKKGWINRNRYLLKGQGKLFSIALKKDSDYLNTNDRYISDGFDRNKLLNQLSSAYRNAPYFKETMGVLNEIVNYEQNNLFDYIHRSLKLICTHIGIAKKIVVSSSLKIDQSLKSEKRVIAICQALNAKLYINAIGGVKLYSKEMFAKEGIELRFIKSKPIEYQQFGNEFVAWLSIIDVLMFNSIENVQYFLDCYELV